MRPSSTGSTALAIHQLSRGSFRVGEGAGLDEFVHTVILW
jgi:hypothetical protein